MKRVGIIYSDKYLNHDTGIHPENPLRLKVIMDKLKDREIINKLIYIDPVLADLNYIKRVHSEDYIRFIRDLCYKGGGSLTPDTPICGESYEIARLASGGVISAINEIYKNNIDRAFCLIRPPGHHAEYDRGMGFCIFNNVAIGARYAQGMVGYKKIFIIDFDVHHGNGTQNIFYYDPSVFYFSIHQYPHYPGTGSRDEVGVREGEGYTLNIPLSAGSGDEEYYDVFKNILIPKVIEFKPDLIIISAGFDAHVNDPLSSMELTSDGFGILTELICKASDEVCCGRIISVLEGGYDHASLSESVNIHIEKLLFCS
jgi:acetoin utilization deacetylase AcuC-like enzyme